MRKEMPRGLIALTFVSAALIVFALWMVFGYAPREAVMGDVQRVFYFHLSAFIGASVAFLGTLVASVAYLRTRNRSWDRIAKSSVEIGLALSAMTILSGPVWASVAWNALWAWDPRLTAVAIMWLIYAAYLMLRGGIDDPDKSARFGAVYGIVAFASVIMTFVLPRVVSTFGSPHPTVIGPGSESGGSMTLTPKMKHTLYVSMVAFVVLYFTLLWHRVRLEELADKVRELQARAFERD